MAAFCSSPVALPASRAIVQASAQRCELTRTRSVAACSSSSASSFIGAPVARTFHAKAPRQAGRSGVCVASLGGAAPAEQPEEEFFATNNEEQAAQAEPEAQEAGEPVVPEQVLAEVLGGLAASAEGEAKEVVDIARGAAEDVVRALNAARSQAVAAEEQAKTLDTQYLRLAADFENFRARSSREKLEAEEKTIGKVVKSLIPVMDSFDRAKSAITTEVESELAIHNSYQGVYKQLLDALSKIGVTQMETEGQMFDPNLHDAMFREETNDVPEGTIMKELARGYIMGEFVIRPAMVAVATAAAEAEAAADS
eukprot:tig00000989_g6092.t1